MVPRPPETFINEFWSVLPVGLPVGSAYVVAHYVLSLLSANLEVARNVSIWYLPAGLLFGCLMVTRGPMTWWIILGDVAARTIWAVAVWPDLLWMVVALAISPMAYGTVTAVLKAPRLRAGFQSSISVTWLIVGIVLAPALAAPLNCLAYAADGVFRFDQLSTVIPNFLIGDLVGIGTLAPLIMAMASVVPKTLQRNRDRMVTLRQGTGAL